MVEPDVLVARGDEEPGAWRQVKVLSDLGAPPNQVALPPQPSEPMW
jgi:hypothetical protein